MPSEKRRESVCKEPPRNGRYTEEGGDSDFKQWSAKPCTAPHGAGGIGLGGKVRCSRPTRRALARGAAISDRRDGQRVGAGSPTQFAVWAGIWRGGMAEPFDLGRQEICSALPVVGIRGQGEPNLHRSAVRHRRRFFVCSHSAEPPWL